MPNLTKYRIEFLLGGQVHTWEQFSTDLLSARARARRALKREYPTGATLLFVREAANG